MSQQTPPLDISYSLETPENVELHTELAGVVVRSLAFCIDFAIRCGVLLAISIIAMFMGKNTGAGVMLIAYFFIEWFYPVLFELLKNGQTPGKKAMGIRVVNDNLTPVSLGPSLIRNLLRAADFLPAAYTCGFISMAAHPHFQRLGDIAAGTIVIYSDHAETKDAPTDTKPSAPVIELSETEQKAIVDFTLRQNTLSESRQHELALLAQQAFSESKPEKLAEKIRSVGAWLLGAR